MKSYDATEKQLRDEVNRWADVLRAAPALSEESINAVAHLNVANRELREYRDGKKEKK